MKTGIMAKAILLLTVLSATVAVYVYNLAMNSHPHGGNVGSPLCGTWFGRHGHVLQLLPDGTGTLGTSFAYDMGRPWGAYLWWSASGDRLTVEHLHIDSTSTESVEFKLDQDTLSLNEPLGERVFYRNRKEVLGLQ
jgi:hypothetical protein